MKSIKKRIISVIPARGSSKGIPRKNIRILAGKPLIAHTIEAVKRIKRVDAVLVSTDDDEIEKISIDYGAEVVKRPFYLALDDTPTLDVVLHLINKYKNFQINTNDIIILLQPTSPLRTSQDIIEALSLFEANLLSCVVSVNEYNHSPYWALKIKDGYLYPLFNYKTLKTRRQDLDPLYIPNGAIYISTPAILQKERNFYCKRCIPYIMPPERSIDIDSEMDFLIAEFLLEKNKI